MKTVIVGNSGSGKSWLAVEISKKTSSPIIHLDEIFWLPGGFDAKRPAAEVDLLVSGHLEKQDWIAEGVFGDLARRFLQFAEELVWLDPGQKLCVARLRERGSESKRHMNRDQSAAGLRQLLDWANSYETRTGSSSASGHKELYEGFFGVKRKLANTQDVQCYINDA
jgi:adenylate kinase family enzyme